jgi:hypothetical protein
VTGQVFVSIPHSKKPLKVISLVAEGRVEEYASVVQACVPGVIYGYNIFKLWFDYGDILTVSLIMLPEPK